MMTELTRLMDNLENTTTLIHGGGGTSANNNSITI
jgi:hypothetical protein